MQFEIIWDWNGTLLNDVEYSVTQINKVLKKYNLPQISVEKYRQIFTFPVIEYYKTLGFDFNKLDFNVVGMEFIELYNAKLYQCKLNNDVYEVLSVLKKNKVKQGVISAREHNSLIKDLNFYQIRDYFDFCFGIDNNFAAGKDILFEKYLAETKTPRKKIFLIGDTTHDCTIAEKYGLNFILYQQGHQVSNHFKNCRIFEKISKMKSLLEIFKIF